MSTILFVKRAKEPFQKKRFYLSARPYVNFSSELLNRVKNWYLGSSQLESIWILERNEMSHFPDILKCATDLLQKSNHSKCYKNPLFDQK